MALASVLITSSAHRYVRQTLFGARARAHRGAPACSVAKEHVLRPATGQRDCLRSEGEPVLAVGGLARAIDEAMKACGWGGRRDDQK